MSTPKSTEESSQRMADVYEMTSRSDSSSIEGGGHQSTEDKTVMISTPGSSHRISPRTNSSSAQEDSGSQRSEVEQKEMSTGEVSSSESRVGTDEKNSSSFSNSSGKTASLGEVLEEGQPSLIIEEVEEVEEEEEEGSTLLNDDKFLAENLDTVLDGFEIFDPQEREEIRKSLADEPESSEALEAVEKVTHVAQSSLKRLQQVVKEKDELILALQEAVASAYRDAMAQQERDQKGLEQLHQIFLSEGGLNLFEMKDSLQQLEAGNGLGGQLAKLFDQYLHELSVQHEDNKNELEISLATWKRRYEELETNLEHEKQHLEAHLSTKLTETVLDWERLKDELQITNGMIEQLKEQLEQKDEQLRIYRESVEILESIVEEEKERQAELAVGYEQITKETRQTLGRVSAVNKQLRVLKTDTSNYHLQGHTNDLEVQELQNKLKHQNAVNHKLGVEIAALRRSSRRSKENGCKGCESLVDMQKHMQLLRDCIPALVAQVLGLKDRLYMTGRGEDSSSNEDHSKFKCLHDFVPVSNMNAHFDPHGYNELVSKSEKTDHSDQRGHPESMEILDKEVRDKDTEVVSHGFSSIESPRTLVKNALQLVEGETMKKLEGHAKITKKVELLQRKLEKCHKAMERNEIDLRRSVATVEHLKPELRKSQEANRELEAKLQKRAESTKKNTTDCVRIKGLLDNIEELEMENTLLKHEVMVQKERQIARLERELRMARQGNPMPVDNPRKSGESIVWEDKVLDLESNLVSKDALILELRFEGDQATWKLDQVKKRFDILFGTLDCKKIELHSPIADSMLNNLFSSEKLSSPALNLLKEKVLARRGYFRSGSRERELEGLVEDLVKVVEKVSHDNEKLTSTCENTVKYMEKNKELRKVVEDLQSQMTREGPSPSRDRPRSAQAALVTDLKSQLSDLTDANSGLLRALREYEDQCTGLKQMIQEQVMRHMSQGDKEKLMNSRRICFSEDEHREQDKRLQAQAQKITELEQQLASRGKDIHDLHEELERKDDELDLVHGKLSLKMLSENQCENIQQNKKDLWSFSQTQTRYRDDRKQAPEDYIDNQYLVEHDHDLTQAENQRLRNFLRTLKNPELLNDIRVLQTERQRMSKVCDRYEELLRVYSRQVGVPFQSLRG